jgi:hypothetical protein
MRQREFALRQQPVARLQLARQQPVAEKGENPEGAARRLVRVGANNVEGH